MNRRDKIIKDLNEYELCVIYEDGNGAGVLHRKEDDSNEEDLYNSYTAYGVSKLFMLIYDIWDITSISEHSYITASDELSDNLLHHMRIMYKYTDKYGMKMSESRFKRVEDIYEFARSTEWVLSLIYSIDSVCDGLYYKNLGVRGSWIYRDQILRDLQEFKCPIVYNTMKDILPGYMTKTSMKLHHFVKEYCVYVQDNYEGGVCNEIQFDKTTDNLYTREYIKKQIPFSYWADKSEVKKFNEDSKTESVREISTELGFITSTVVEKNA